MLWRVTCVSAPERNADGRAGYHRHGRFFPLGEAVIVDDAELLPGSGLLSDPHLRAEPLEPEAEPQTDETPPARARRQRTK